MARKKIILTTNPPWMLSGLGESGKFLASHLQRTGKYDIVYYCSQTHEMDPALSRTPWKSYGSIPNDQNIINEMNKDPMRARAIAYGAYYIDKIVREEKPDILWCSDDAWSFALDFFKAPWWNKINSIMHITADSLPILELCYEQAKSTPHYYTWAKFAMNAMRKRGPEFAHVKQIYGMTDINNFAPISKAERMELRKANKIDPNTVVIGYTFRNQLRKEALTLLLGFKQFKQANPKANVKIHLHTSWSETNQGWDFPRMIKNFELDPNDVLCTYVCKRCNGWHVRPFGGEDIDCPLCGAKGKDACCTPTIGHGVLREEMKYMYGIRDATVSPITSGGLEYENVNTVLCGIPLATTSYSSGEDFCEQPFVYPIKWKARFETGTSFMKAANDASSIQAFIEKVYHSKKSELEEIGAKGRDWAVKTFSVDVIGKQWEDLFDSLPPKDWSTITLESKQLKNETYPMPDITSNEAWIKSLYNNILLVEPDPDGMKNWLARLSEGVSRQNIYEFFIGRAKEDNSKSSAKPMDFGDLFDKNDRKRILYVIKESGGDIFICTATFKGLKDLYPDADLYVACEPKFAEILAGNPYVHRVLAYHPAMEQELLMIKYVSYYYYPALPTQKQLAYLSKDKIGLKLDEVYTINLNTLDASLKALETLTT